MSTDYQKLLHRYIAHVRRTGDDHIDSMSLEDRRVLFGLSPRTAHLGAAVEYMGPKSSGWFSGIFSR